MVKYSPPRQIRKDEFEGQGGPDTDERNRI
jgi:hypothetical protein